MDTQSGTTLNLFDEAPRLIKHFASAQERFEYFHRQNPKVYRVLVDYARQIKARGFTRYSIKTIWAVMRWHYDTGTRGPEEHFRLDDRYYSRYARKIMSQESDLRDFFSTRELRT
jgi:hypothetical protein